MNRHLLRALLALYPRAFRDRYGTELASLTDELIRAGEITPLLAVLNLAGGAALEWGRVLTGSRRAALAVAAAAVMAAAGSFIVAAAGIFYVTGHARPPGTAASAGSVGVNAVVGQFCADWFRAVGVNPAWTAQFAAGTNAAAKPGRAFEVPVFVLMPGQLIGIQTGPSPSQAKLGAAGPCGGMVYGFVTSKKPAVGSVLTIDGVKFWLIGIAYQPQAGYSPDVFVPLALGHRQQDAQRLPLQSGSLKK